MDQQDKDKNRKKIQQIGVFTTIPFVLIVSPMIGWFIGKWLDKFFETAPYLMYALIILGFAAGIRECYRIIKKYGNEV